MRNSKYIIHSFAIITALIIVLALSCGKAADKQMTVLFTIGKANLISGDKGNVPLLIGQKLKKGDILKTGAKSFAILQFGESALIRIQEKSTVAITSVFDLLQTKLSLKEGRVLSAVHKLQKGEGYIVKTPTITAAVRGTEFSVSYYKTKSTVAVHKSIVQVSMEKEEKEIKEHSRAVASDEGIAVERIKKKESLEIKRIADVPPLQKIESKSETEVKEYGEKYFSNGGDEDNKAPMTLEKLKEKYGRIDEVILYSGKVYHGVITKRGREYIILTPRGEVTVPNKKVKYTREK